MSTIKLTYNDRTLNLKEGSTITIGRMGHNADIEIDSSQVSRKHAQLEYKEGKLYLQDTESLNGVKYKGEKLPKNEKIEIYHNDSFSILDHHFKVHTKTLTNSISKQNISKNESLSEKVPPKITQNDDGSLLSKLKQQVLLRFGRSQSNDIVIDDLTVSRNHGVFLYENGKIWVKDENSSNGTYVNGTKIAEKTEINYTDDVIVSLFSIDLKKGVKDLRKEKSAISAKGIQKKYPNGKIGLNPLSLEIPQASFIALMGPSGCGKSTLLKCLNYDNPATSGNVKIHGLDLAKNINLLKRKIGYVPQDDIIHSQLTVYQTLYFACKLRLPDDTSENEIEQRINKVIQSLSLQKDKDKDIKEVKVKDLSGGQRKRVSIAVELLVEPTILFLDEPTSPLDPESIDSFLNSLKQLTKEGTTIVMVTHKPEDLNYVDDVIFLMIKGFMAYYGKPEDILNRFKVNDIIKVYSKLSDEKDFDNNLEEYYVRPEQTQFRPSAAISINDKEDSSFKQWFWLTKRYQKIKFTDKSNMVMLLAQPLIIAALVCIIFDELQLGVLFLMSISAIWFGVSNSAKEIVGELPIYRRERMFNIKLNPYILSKWVVLSGISFIQTILFVGILFIKFKIFPHDAFEGIYLKSFPFLVLYMFFMAVSASLIGLLLSASFSNTERVMTVVPIALMPQIMLAGVITRIDSLLIEFLSFFTLGRWGTDGLGKIQDMAYNADDVETAKSLLTRVPNIQSQTNQLEFQETNANVLLSFYDEKLINNGNLIGDIFNSMQANILIVCLLNILMYILIYTALKRKDTL